MCLCVDTLNTHLNYAFGCLTPRVRSVVTLLVNILVFIFLIAASILCFYYIGDWLVIHRYVVTNCEPVTEHVCVIWKMVIGFCIVLVGILAIVSSISLVLLAQCAMRMLTCKETKQDMLEEVDKLCEVVTQISEVKKE